MRILVVNPNTTASMTASIGVAASAAASADTTVVSVNPDSGPVSIEGYYDEVFSIPGLLEELAKGEREGYDGFVIACFDDTGLDAARCLVNAPVVGICEAAMHMATMVGDRFSVVTTLARSVPALESLAVRYGVASRCSIRASDIPVLAIDDPASGARDKIAEHIRLALAEDRAESIVLGCAGMTDLAQSLSDEFGVPVLDGVACAVRQVEALAGLGLKTSKIGGYASPLPKAYLGNMKPFQPESA